MKTTLAFVLVMFSLLCNAQNVTGNLVTDPNFTNTTDWTVTGHGSNTSHPVVGPGQYSFGTQGSIAQSIAINNALSGSGISVTGIQYGWRFALYCNNPVGGNSSTCQSGTGASDTLTANVNVTNSSGGTIFDRTHNYNTRLWAWVNEAQDVNFTSTPLASMGHINMTFTGTDGGASTGDPYMGPSISSVYARLKYGVETVDPCITDALSSPSCPGYQQAYTNQQCASNPLYSTSCSGYAIAYKTQQCSVNPLYATDCPGYATAYKSQQCSISPLYATDCPGYAESYKTQQCYVSALYATDCPGYADAYLKSQCIRDSLYSTQCEGYKTAYAIKYLVNLSPAVTSAVNQQLTTTVEIQKADPANVVSATGDSTVDSVVSAPSTTSVTSTTSPTSVTAPKENSAANSTTNPPALPPPAANKQDDKQEKKTDSQMASMEKKSGGNKENAKKEAGEKGKQLANEIASATSIEQQQAIQGSLVGVMNFVPGFSSYSTALIPDINGLKMAKQYNKPVIDNLSAQRRMSGASDSKWQEMVDSQFNLGK